MLKKSGTLILLLMYAILLAGCYGILHDQLTYTISPEYYTKFKFRQFGLAEGRNEAIFPYPRTMVAAVGWMASWWMGIPVGLILGFTGLIHRDWKKMWKVTTRAFDITLAIAFITGLIGLAYGHFFLAGQPRESFYRWYLPYNLIDYRNFVKVGSMHNFSYFGGLAGVIIAIIYSVRQKRKTDRVEHPGKDTFGEL